MIKFRGCIFILILIFCSIQIIAQTKSNNIQTIDGTKYYIHKIEKSQSLYSISKLYGVTLDEIYLLNPEVKSGTKINQEIKLLYKAESVITTTATVATKTAVVNNNTASTVSKTLSVPNNSTIAGAIDTKTISAPGSIDTNKYYIHQVLKRETLYSITKKYNISEAELKILNPSIITHGIKQGEIIIVGEKKTVIVKTHEIKQVYTHADSVNPNVIHKPIKNNYNLALMLPFKTDLGLALDLTSLIKSNTNFPMVSVHAIDFYLGFKSAMDSLISNEFGLNLDLYDIDDKDSLKLVQLVNDSKFKNHDFIFGPLHANGFKTISHKAIEYGIPVVYPITQQNKMLYNNVYASKTKPSQFTLLECLADYCIDSLMANNANILLMAPFANDAKEITYVKAFKKYFNEIQLQKGKTAKDTITVVKNLDGVKKAFVPNVKNIIVTLSINEIFIADFTTQLAIFADKKDITLCGWQSIGNIDNIDQEYLNQLHFVFPSPYNISNTNLYVSAIENYKMQQNTYPGENFFIGYDIAQYYLKNLKENGPDFIFKLNKYPKETNYMRFKFIRPDNLTGFDNRGVYIFKYNNYQLQKTGWQ